MDASVASPEDNEAFKMLSCLELKVVQSDELKAPLFEAEAVGTFNVITGVVVEFATVELKSVPVVPNVSAATLVTVPTLNVLSADKSCVVPLIVIVRVGGTKVGKLANVPSPLIY